MSVIKLLYLRHSMSYLSMSHIPLMAAYNTKLKFVGTKPGPSFRLS